MQLASTKRKTIYINGAGIAGLTAAICLARLGYHIEVHERAEGFETVGAGIQISPNAYHIMNDIGIGTQLRRLGHVPDAIDTINAYNGNLIASIPIGTKASARYHAPYLVIHRADLHAVLFKRCQQFPNIKMYFESEITDFAEHPNGVSVQVLRDNQFVEGVGILLVIADGIHSKLRNNVVDITKPKFEEKAAWRALVPFSDVSEHFKDTNTRLWFGKNAHAVTYPIKGDKFLNVVAITNTDSEDKLETISREAIAAHFSGWSSQFTDLFTTKATWSGWPLYHTPKINRLGSRNVVLIGDAGHAMLPFAAQGAAMAIEDAAVLAKQISLPQPVPTAIERFEESRIPRINRVLKTARENGEIYHMAPPYNWMRNTVMKMTPKSMLLNRQDWIFKWKP